MCAHARLTWNSVVVFLHFQEGTLVVGGPGSFYWQGNPKISAPVLGSSDFIGWKVLREDEFNSHNKARKHASPGRRLKIWNFSGRGKKIMCFFLNFPPSPYHPTPCHSVGEQEVGVWAL